MEDDEKIDDFVSRLRDIVNESLGLGEKVLEEKLGRKILRSLPERFDMKVIVIEEVQDTSLR